MADKNDITGASLVTKPSTEEFKKGYDSIVWVLGEEATQIDLSNRSDSITDMEYVVSDMKPQCCGCCGDEC